MYFTSERARKQDFFIFARREGYLTKRALIVPSSRVVPANINHQLKLDVGGWILVARIDPGSVAIPLIAGSSGSKTPFGLPESGLTIESPMFGFDDGDVEGDGEGLIEALGEGFEVVTATPDNAKASSLLQDGPEPAEV